MRYANSRPGYGPDQEQTVWDKQARPDGTVRVTDIDDNPVTIPPWKKGDPRDGVWDMGHIPGQEYEDLKDDYLHKRITYEEFMREYRDPSHYRVEHPSRNRAHVDE